MSGGCLSGCMAGGGLRRLCPWCIRGLLRSVALSRFPLLPKESGFRPFSPLLPKECRGTVAVCRALGHIPAFYSFRRSRVSGCFCYSFRSSAGAHSRFAALWGTFPLSTPSEGVGFLAVFATPSEGVRGMCVHRGCDVGTLYRDGAWKAVTDSRCQ